MKRSMFFAAVLSAILLAGCTKENELIDELETLSITAPEQLTQVPETEKKIIETEGEAQFIFGGETETSVSINEISENEKEYSTENLAIKIFNYGGLAPTVDGVKNFYEHNYFIKDNIFGSGYGVFSANGGSDIKYQIRLFDTDENKLLTAVDLPEGYMIEDYIPQTDGLCRYIISNLVYDKENDYSTVSYAVMTIRNDLSYDISENYTPQSRSLKCCGHNIAEWERDIVDTDSGDILAEGYDGTSEYDIINMTRKLYKFPIDENRFVYSTGGHESIPGFGIYDFSERTRTDVPDSRDLVPIGVHGGKIYSVKAAWSGFGTDIYTTDTETLETEFFMECPFIEDAADYADYAMPESGNYIALIFTPRDAEAPAVLYGIDPDTKEVVSADIPNDFEHYSLRPLKENSVMISNCSDKVLIAEINF